jgi:hypothetical protein
MPVFLLTDFDAPNFALEEKLFADAGMRLQHKPDPKMKSSLRRLPATPMAC